MDNVRQADASIKAGLIGLFGMLSAALVTHYQAKKREINARHFADKREGYMHMIDLLFDLIMSMLRKAKSCLKRSCLKRSCHLKGTYRLGWTTNY